MGMGMDTDQASTLAEIAVVVPADITVGVPADSTVEADTSAVEDTVAVGTEVATGVIDSAAGSNAQPVRLSLTGALSFWAVQ
jgi:hypothetical protein